MATGTTVTSSPSIQGPYQRKTFLPQSQTMKFIQQDDTDYLTITEEDTCFSDACSVIDARSLSESSSCTDISPCNESLSASSSCSSLETEFQSAIASSNISSSQNGLTHTTIISNGTANASQIKGNKVLSRLINGQYESDINTSSDSLSTFVLGDSHSNESRPVSMTRRATTPNVCASSIPSLSAALSLSAGFNEDPLSSSLPCSPSQEPIKKLKSSLKLNNVRNNLQRSNSMPSFSFKKSVKFPSSGLEDVVFFRKHDTPSSVSAATSSEEDDEEVDNEASFHFDDDTFSSGFKHNNNDGFFDYDYDFPASIANDKSKANFFLDYDSDESEADTVKKLKSYWKVVGSNFGDLISSSNKMNHNKIVDLNSNVLLENMYLSENIGSSNSKKTSYLVGNILVKNIAFEKHVSVKLTTNNWSSFKQIKASYLESLSNNIDRFHFKMNLNKLNSSNNLGNKKLNVKFCLGYQVYNAKYWDNNNNLDYSLKLTKHSSRRGHRKQVSESSVSMLNELLENTSQNTLKHNFSKKVGGRYFPEDNIENWFKKSPTNNFTNRYSFDLANNENEDAAEYPKDYSDSAITLQEDTENDTFVEYSGSEGNKSAEHSSKFSSLLNGQSYHELVANYCFYDGSTQF